MYRAVALELAPSLPPLLPASYSPESLTSSGGKPLAKMGKAAPWLLKSCFHVASRSASARHRSAASNMARSCAEKDSSSSPRGRPRSRASRTFPRANEAWTVRSCSSSSACVRERAPLLWASEYQQWRELQQRGVQRNMFVKQDAPVVNQKQL
jgi:hypothetical protein